MYMMYFRCVLLYYNYKMIKLHYKKTKLAESKILPDWKYFLYYNCCLWLEWNKQKKINKCIKKPKIHLKFELFYHTKYRGFSHLGAKKNSYNMSLFHKF